jgi:hypothetical protein
MTAHNATFQIEISVANQAASLYLGSLVLRVGDACSAD